MKRLNLKQSVHSFALMVGAIALAACCQAGAQTPPPPPAKKIVIPPPAVKVVKPAPVKAATPAPAKAATPAPTAAKAVVPAAAVKTTATATAKPATTIGTQKAVAPTTTTTTGVTPAASRTAVVPATTAVSSTATSTALPSTSTPSTALSGLSSASNGYSAPAGADPRTPVVGQGVGNFLWPGGWTLTAYGCFRTGTRLFCDFDTTNQNNTAANAGPLWSGGGGVNVVDDGGKITGRHNSFFVGDDGSQFTTAYIGPQPVRFIIEYDDVDQRYTSISLVLGANRIAGVPITTMDPSQPAGTMPTRTSVGSPAPGAPGTPATAQSGNGLDKATQAISNVNDQKKKAQSLWQSVQGAVQPH